MKVRILFSDTKVFEWFDVDEYREKGRPDLFVSNNLDKHELTFTSKHERELFSKGEKALANTSGNDIVVVQQRIKVKK